MGCDCCKRNLNNPFHTTATDKKKEVARKHGGCFANRAYRDNTCGVVFPEEKKAGYRSNYTPPKKKRKKNKRK